MEVTTDHAHQAEVLLTEVEEALERKVSAGEEASIPVLVALAQVHATLTVAEQLRIVGKGLQESNAPMDISATLSAVESLMEDKRF